MNLSGSPPLVIGCGNDLRGDDAVGLWVARRLRQCDGFRIVENHGDPTALIDAWSGAALVYIVDALSPAATPGALYIFDGLAPLAHEKPFRCSTHGQSILTAIELAQALDCLPPQLTIIAVEGKTFDYGTALSAEARSGAERALRVITDACASEAKGTNDA